MPLHSAGVLQSQQLQQGMCRNVMAGAHLMPRTSGSFMMSTMTRFLLMGSAMMSVISCLYLCRSASPLSHQHRHELHAVLILSLSGRKPSCRQARHKAGLRSCMRSPEGTSLVLRSIHDDSAARPNIYDQTQKASSSPSEPLRGIGGGGVVEGEVVVDQHVQPIGRKEPHNVQEACVGRSVRQVSITGATAGKRVCIDSLRMHEIASADWHQ